MSDNEKEPVVVRRMPIVGLRLTCGHVSEPIERLRVGSWKWCGECAAWKEEQ